MIHDNPLFDNVTCDPRLLGLEILLSPYANKTGSQRLAMQANQSNQAMVVAGGEHPRVASGWETMIGEYEFDTTVRENDVVVMGIANKYQIDGNGIKENPTQTVIYQDVETHIAGYFHRNTYTKCSNGFGYRNKWAKFNISEGTYIPKDVKLVTSPIHDGNGYGLGVNLNTAFISLTEVTEDAFMITESAAKKFLSSNINTITIDFSWNKVRKMVPLRKNPLNEPDYKFFTDIGNTVDDGAFLWFRDISSSNMISTFTDDISITTPQLIHDDPIVMPAGSTILDIDIYVNKKNKNFLEENAIYSQLLKYLDQKIKYYKKIVTIYQELSSRGIKISHALNTLVTEAYAYLIADGYSFGNHTKNKRVEAIKLVKRNEVIEFVTMDVVYEAKYNISPGFKFTGRDGSKGVVGSVIADEDTIVDEYGFKADFIQDATPAVFNRMNCGQLAEAHYNRTGEFVRRRVESLANGIMPDGIDLNDLWFKGLTTDRAGAFRYAIEFLERACEQMYKAVIMTIKTDKDKEDFLNQVIEEGFYFLNIPYTYIPTEKELEIAEKYPAPLGRVKFNIKDRFGNKKQVITDDPVNIGSKYVYVLCKIPFVMAPGVGYINQHKTPIIPSAYQRNKFPISQTVVRIGEDEVRNLIMAAGPMVTARLLGLYANSNVAVERLTHSLLTEEYPSRIPRIDIKTEDIINTNNIVSVTKHIFSCFGVDINKRVENSQIVRLHESQKNLNFIPIENKGKD